MVRTSALLALLLFTSGLSEGQTKGVSISGTVLIPDGTPVKGISIELRSSDFKKVASQTSDKDGRFQFSDLKPSSYSLLVAATGGIKKYEKHVLALSSVEGIRIQLTFADTFRGMSIRTLIDYLRSTAGPNAVDCGHVALDKATRQTDDCVDANLKLHKPFYASYEFQGIDSQMAMAVLLTPSSQFQFVQFSSMGYELTNLAPNEVASGSSVVATLCPPPKTIEHSREGWLRLEEQCRQSARATHK